MSVQPKDVLFLSPRSIEQNKLIRDERRDQILEHAMRLFAKKGYASTKISDVAQSTSLSQGLVYHYFASKEELYIAVAEQTIELSNNAMKMFSSLQMEPCEIMRIMTERNLGYEDPDGYALRWFLMFQIGISGSVPAEAKNILKKKFAAVEYVKKVIEEGQKKGQFSTEKDAESLSTAYWSLMEGIVFFNALNNTDTDSKIAVPDAETVLKLFQ